MYCIMQSTNREELFIILFMNKSSVFIRLSNYAQQAKKYFFAHKIRSVFAIFLVFIAGYWVYQKAFASDTETRYVLSTVSKSTIIVSVSGSGQVSPSNQVDIHPKASGQITSVRIKNGQTVSAGDVIAYIDSTDAMASVRDAQDSLKSAQLSLQKVQKPADQLTLTQAQNAVDKARESKATAENDLAKAYSNAVTDITATFLDLPDLMTNYKDTVIGSSSNHNSQWNIDYYRNAVQTFDNNAITYRDNTYETYKTAKARYDGALGKWQSITSASSQADIEAALSDTYDMTQTISTGLNTTNAFIRFYSDTLKNRDQTPVASASTALTSLNTYITTTNQHTSELLTDINAIRTAKNAIASANRSITESEQSLQKTKDGTDTLDIQSAQLTVNQRQNALLTAQNNLADYVIRAPFDGTIANLNLNVGDEVSSGTTVATEITSQDLAVLSVNEVDAAKIESGQKATLTFDAIDDLTLTGVVTNVNPIGTVSSGVVSYEVQIAFDAQDSRVKAGMTVNASIITNLKQDALVVPSSAVKSQNGTSYVLVFDTPPENEDSASSSAQGVTSDTAPRQQVVETGLTNDTDTEITSGLKEGDTFVTRTINTTTTSSSGSSFSLFGGPGTRSSSNSSSRSSNGSSGSTRATSNTNGAGGPPPGM